MGEQGERIIKERGVDEGRKTWRRIAKAEERIKKEGRSRTKYIEEGKKGRKEGRIKERNRGKVETRSIKEEVRREREEEI